MWPIQCRLFLAIATNIPQQLKTGFVVQGHILQSFKLIMIQISSVTKPSELPKYIQPT